MKIQREKLSDQAYSILKGMIENARFQPGSRLNVERISKELGVSRTPVWEAVNRLQQEGLLVNLPNRGVFMASLTPEQALDLYAVREILEGMAARLASIRMDKRSLAKMDELLQRQEMIVKSADLVAFSESDFELHNLVYERCGNPYLQELLQSIKDKMRPICMQIEPILFELYEDHKKLYQSLRRGKPQEAEKIFREHNRLLIRHIQEEITAGRHKEAGNAARAR